MKRVSCFLSGGTIASTYDREAGGLVATLGAADLLTRTPDLAKIAEVETVELARTGSTSIESRQAFEWSRRVEADLRRPDICGAVVIQGTNTLEECAALFDLTVPADKPVVFTGAMRAPAEAGFDGGRNVLGAVAVAAHDGARGLGTMVVANDEIHAALAVEKTHTSGVDAFSSPSRGPIGALLDDGREPSIFVRPSAHERLRPPQIESRVELLTAVLGADARLVEAALAGGARGLVVAALGSGDVPAKMAAALADAVAAGIPVVVARRAVAGAVLPRYAEVGDGRWLADRGVLFAGDLSAPKARVKLMLALGFDDPDLARTFFTREPAAAAPAGCSDH